MNQYTSPESYLSQIKVILQNIQGRLPALGAATEATLALVKAKTDNIDVLLSTRTKPSDTQPVSLASQPLPTGASTEATQALVKAKTDNLDVLLSTRATETTLGTRLADATFTGRINTQGQKTMAASTPVALASDQSAIPFTPPTLTKGTQGATGVSTQDLKDAGRTAFAATANAVAGVTVEAMLSMVPVRAGVAAAGATSIAVTSGKRLHLTMMVVSFRTGAAAANWSRFLLRTNPAGAVVATSPVLIPVELEPQAAVSGVGQSVCIPLPDGFEFSGTEQVGVSHISLATTNIECVALIGFEY